jgi:hypothetical protein
MGSRLFGPTLQSQNRSPSDRGTKTARAVAGTGRWQSSSSSSYAFFVAHSRSDSSSRDSRYPPLSKEHSLYWLCFSSNLTSFLRVLGIVERFVSFSRDP